MCVFVFRFSSSMFQLMFYVNSISRTYFCYLWEVCVCVCVCVCVHACVSGLGGVQMSVWRDRMRTVVIILVPIKSILY